MFHAWNHSWVRSFEKLNRREWFRTWSIQLHLYQQGSRLRGTHRGDFVSRDVSGRVEGSTIRIRSSYTEEHGDSLACSFNGRLAGDVLSGTLDMGEYLAARWTARRS